LQLAFDFGHFTIEAGLDKTELLVEELTSLRGFHGKQGRTIEAPDRKHDDIALALSLAWWGVETRRPRISASTMNTARQENGANTDVRRTNNEAPAAQKPNRHVLPKIDLTRWQHTLTNENETRTLGATLGRAHRALPARLRDRARRSRGHCLLGWRLIRARTLDTALWTIRVEQQKEALADTDTTPTEPARLACVTSNSFGRDLLQNNSLSANCILRSEPFRVDVIWPKFTFCRS
jgi:hypothetical protein